MQELRHGDEGVFSKSGNAVRFLRVSRSRGYHGLLEVERVDGHSAGKRMLIPKQSFISKASWNSLTQAESSQ